MPEVEEDTLDTFEESPLIYDQYSAVASFGENSGYNE